MFEISFKNVDKPDLSLEEISKRIKQFKTISELLVTNKATFLEKSVLFKGADFLIGGDTLIRLFDNKYYNTEMDSNKIIDQFIYLKNSGTQFVVGGRTIDNKFVNVDLFKSAPTTHKLGTVAPNSNIFFPAYSRVDPVSKLSLLMIINLCYCLF